MTDAGGGLVTSKTVGRQPGGNMTAGFQYDNEGRLTGITYPFSNLSYTYTYDVLGRPTQMTAPGFNLDVVKDVSYNVAGELTVSVRPTHLDAD